MSTKVAPTIRFAVCTDNSGYPASLEVGKLYPIIPDPAADRHGYIRVIDESAEDYGYSAERFYVLQLPPALARSLNGRSGGRARHKTQESRSVARNGRRRVNA